MAVPENSKYGEAFPPKTSGYFGLRHIQFFLLFLGVFLSYGMRTNLSVGIVAMLSDEEKKDVPTYPEWEDKKNLMLSSFFWGYVIPQIGAGQIAKQYGPKLFLGIAIGVSSVFSVLLPVFAIYIGWEGVLASRMIQGFCQGFLFPSTHHLLSKWSSISERSKTSTFIYTGGLFGTVIAMLVTGVMADSNIGWPLVFYVYGVLGIVWSLLWVWLGKNSPADYNGISEAERKYIEYGSSNTEDKHIPTPWKAIFTSLPFWAILVAHGGQNWGFWTLMTEIPTYMDKILKYDVKNNGALSALPYFVLWILSFIMSPIADYLITHKIISIGGTRKIFNSIGLLVPAFALIGLGYVEDKTFAVVLLVIAVGFNAAVYCGFNVNHIDLSPNHAGTLMGITNSVSNVLSIIAPLTIDAYGLKETNPILWRYVFFVAAGIYGVTAAFFVFAGSGEIQPWNHDPDETSIS